MRVSFARESLARLSVYWSRKSGWVIGLTWSSTGRTRCVPRENSGLNTPLKMVVRAMDLFHVAIAIEVGADALLSFDTDQIALAGVAGLSVFKLADKRG